MQKIVWSWFDGEGTYANKAESLQEIIQEVVEYYYHEGAEVNVKRCDSFFEVQILDQANGHVNLYKPEASMSAIGEFLTSLARLEDRPDVFCIEGIL